MATMQFAMCDIVADFLLRYPKVNVVAHATDRNVDIVGEKRAGLPNLRLYDLRHSGGRRGGLYESPGDLDARRPWRIVVLSL